MNKPSPELAIIKTATWKLDFLGNLAKMRNDQLINALTNQVELSIMSEDAGRYDWKIDSITSEILDRMVSTPKDIK